MTRTRTIWLALFAAVAVLVAYQTVVSAAEQSAQFIAAADVPTVAPGEDVLAGVAVVPLRVRSHHYRRAAFGESWTDDNDAPGGHNGCDTRFLGGFGVLSETLREVPFTPRTFR